jgi:tRNA threonylcarbamoyladenosine biosynthesis protein TsaE
MADAPTVRVTESEAETEAAGRALAGTLGPGAVVLLSGELGAGKTAFVRGLATGLGADPSLVSSPTFTLVHEYTGASMVLYHADLYRLSPREAAELGLAEISENGVLAVEWPDRWPSAPPVVVNVSIVKAGETRREISWS